MDAGPLVESYHRGTENKAPGFGLRSGVKYRRTSARDLGSGALRIHRIGLSPWVVATLLRRGVTRPPCMQPRVMTSTPLDVAPDHIKPLEAEWGVAHLAPDRLAFTRTLRRTRP